MCYDGSPIYTEDWYSRREVAFGPAVACAGILLKLLDEQESYEEGRAGPAELALRRRRAAAATGGDVHDVAGYERATERVRRAKRSKA